MPRFRTSILLVLAFQGLPLASAQEYEAYYLNLRRNHPVGETDWSNDVQGVAHDDDSWFITQTESIWRIPVELDLNSVTAADPGVIRRDFSDYPALAGYHHFGDPVVYKYNGVNYLLAPIEGPGFLGTIAIFYCAGLIYIDHVQLTNQTGDAGWCAVDKDGKIYSSSQHAFHLKVYDFDWPLFQSTNQATVTLEDQAIMTDEQGGQLELVTMQGGEFAPGDGFLYLISGFYDDDNGLEESEGIHAMRQVVNPNGEVSWQRVAHSTRGYGYFDYYYDPGFPTYEEPEGLTIWDLDDGRAPGIRGQLHAFVSDNDAEAGDVDFKHYTNIIRVVANGPCEYAGCCTSTPPPGCPTPFNDTCEFGVAQCPFRTVSGATDLAWGGSEIRIQAGMYDETLTISKRVRLAAEGGTVRIGG